MPAYFRFDPVALCTTAGAFLLATPPCVSAQAVAPVVHPRAVFALLGDTATKRPELPPTMQASAPAQAPWWTPLASAVVPGAGQARLGQDRFVAYAAVEGYLWIRYLSDSRAGASARRRYRDLALRVSRAPFPGPKPVGNFEYYERMEHWVASGTLDSDPASGIQPEPDTTTFNGSIWLLARRTYWSSPATPPPPGSAAESAAMSFYLRSAVAPEFAWSWRNAPLQQDEYRRRIRASNEAFRRAAHDVGAVLANHLLSTVDAYISMRLRVRSSPADGSIGLEGSLTFR
jgi:hypothetical protein